MLRRLKSIGRYFDLNNHIVRSFAVLITAESDMVTWIYNHMSYSHLVIQERPAPNGATDDKHLVYMFCFIRTVGKTSQEVTESLRRIEGVREVACLI